MHSLSGAWAHRVSTAQKSYLAAESPTGEPECLETPGQEKEKTKIDESHSEGLGRTSVFAVKRSTLEKMNFEEKASEHHRRPV